MSSPRTKRELGIWEFPTRKAIRKEVPGYVLMHIAEGITRIRIPRYILSRILQRKRKPVLPPRDTDMLRIRARKFCERTCREIHQLASIQICMFMMVRALWSLRLRTQQLEVD